MTQTIYSLTDKLQFHMPRSAHTQHFVTWQRTGCAHLSGRRSVSLAQLEVLNLLLVQLCSTNVYFKHFELDEVLLSRLWQKESDRAKGPHTPHWSSSAKYQT